VHSKKLEQRKFDGVAVHGGIDRTGIQPDRAITVRRLILEAA